MMHFLLAAALLAAPAADGDGARQLVVEIYSHYDAPGESGMPVDPPERLFEPVLAAAMRADRARADAADEVPTLDFDPFCQSQDGAPFTAAIAPAEPAGTGAEVRVRFTNLGTEHRLTYTLVRTPAGWRIADIDDGESWSLRSLYFPGTP